MGVPDITVGILAGGASSRMGTNKALLDVRGVPLLRRQLDVLRPIAAEVLLGANDPAPYAGFDVRIVPDRLAEPCSLTGLHALLHAATRPHLLAVACDLPFLNPELLRDLLGRRHDADVVLPVSDRGPEPLHAVYARGCLPAIEAAARRGDWKMLGFHKDVRVETVRIRDSEWAVDGRSPFTNVNTPDEWRAAGP